MARIFLVHLVATSFLAGPSFVNAECSSVHMDRYFRCLEAAGRTKTVAQMMEKEFNALTIKRIQRCFAGPNAANSSLCAHTGPVFSSQPLCKSAGICGCRTCDLLYSSMRQSARDDMAIESQMQCVNERVNADTQVVAADCFPQAMGARRGAVLHATDYWHVLDANKREFSYTAYMLARARMDKCRLHTPALADNTDRCWFTDSVKGPVGAKTCAVNAQCIQATSDDSCTAAQLHTKAASVCSCLRKHLFTYIRQIMEWIDQAADAAVNQQSEEACVKLLHNLKRGPGGVNTHESLQSIMTGCTNMNSLGISIDDIMRAACRRAVDVSSKT